MAVILYRVPYEFTIRGADIKSGKTSSTVLHMRTIIDPVGPAPAYAASIGALSSDTFMLGQFRTAWINSVLPRLSVNMLVAEYRVRPILGWTVGGVMRGITGATNTNPISITTAADHNLRNGDTVVITGVLGNTAANGTWAITVGGTNFFTIPVAGNGVYAGGGTYALQQVPPRLDYGVGTSLIPAAPGDAGGVAGEALPLFATMSVRKVATKSGRNFRGGFRLSPISEADSNNGAVVPAVQTARQTAMATFLVAVVGTGVGVDEPDRMEHMVFSRSLALQQTTPFTGSDVFSSPVASFPPSPNDGSIVRRKPRLNAIIQQP